MSHLAELERSFEGILPRWHAVVCEERFERAVAKGVERLGFETLVPLRHVDVIKKGAANLVPELVIPGYCFARFSTVGARWTRINKIRGVEGILSEDDGEGYLIPVPIPDGHMKLPIGAHRVFAYVELVRWLVREGKLEPSNPNDRLSKKERKRLDWERRQQRLEMLYGT